MDGRAKVLVVLLAILPIFSMAASGQALHDSRDKTVSAPNRSFDKMTYWDAMTRCGMAYMTIGIHYIGEAADARLRRRDEAAYAVADKLGGEATDLSLALFGAALRFLASDRRISAPEARKIFGERSKHYEPRYKTIELAKADVNSCQSVYQTCRKQFPDQCSGEPAPK